MKSEEITLEMLRADSLFSLQKIERRIQRINASQGISHRNNWLLEIQTQLQCLATEYSKRRKRQDQTDQRQFHYKSLTAAAQKLQHALNHLSKDELNEISRQQETCFQDYMNEFPEEEQYYVESDEPFRPCLASQINEWNDLIWLINASVQLLKARKRGGQTIDAERWAACEFVLICREFGWWPIRFAKVGTEKKGKLQQSPAVVCLAAVYSEAGTPIEKCLTHAFTTLDSLRHFHSHGRVEPQYEDEDEDEDEVFDTIRYVSLTNVIETSSPMMAGKLPWFGPK